LKSDAPCCNHWNSFDSSYYCNQIDSKIKRKADMPRQPREHVVRPREAIRDRVKFLLDYRWNGNQRQMARDMAVSQGLISKIVNGLQGAGRCFLATLARQPGVNADWLLHGEGQPLSLPPKGTVPVALGVLPGPPPAHPQLLTGQRHPVAEALDRASRYWLELQSGSPLLRDAGLRLLAGDLLLMETDRAWISRVDLIEGRLCGVRLPLREPNIAYALGKLYRDPLGLVFDAALEAVFRLATLPVSPSATTPPSPAEMEERKERPQVKVRRKVGRLDQEEKKAEARNRAMHGHQGAAAEPQEDLPPALALQDIIAVCVYLARPSPGIGRTARVSEVSPADQP
jgi:hypothetical protein